MAVLPMMLLCCCFRYKELVDDEEHEKLDKVLQPAN